MTVAGIDFGTTLTKVAWRKKDGTYGLRSTAIRRDEDGGSADDAPSPHDVLELALETNGVTHLRATGIGDRWLLSCDFTIEEPAGDPIEDEIRLQADGVSRLLGSCSGMMLADRPESFLLVSIGTGVSYTLVVKGKAERFPYGNAIGGGFISGLSRILNYRDFADIERAAAQEEPLDLRIRDVLAASAGTPMGELVVAHFGKVRRPDITPGGLMASALHCVATSVIRDVLIMDLTEKYRVPGPLVFIGSTVSTFTSLTRYLSNYAAMIGAEAKFPDYGEYAAAVGALHAAEGT